MSIEWKNPPAVQPRKADLVAAQLRARPGEWARIDQNRPPLDFMPWWAPLSNDGKYEVKFVRVDPDQPFGLRDVYARFKAQPPPPVGPGNVSR